MELKRAEVWRDGGFLVDIVEEALPHDQRIVGIARVAVAVSPAVAERLARQLDELPRPVAPDKGKIVREGIAVPEIALVHEELDAVRALRAGAPADRTPPGARLEHFERAPDDVALFLAREIARDLVVIAVAGHLVAALGDRRQRLGKSLGDPAAGHEGCLYFRLIENAEDAPNTGVRSVFALCVFFVVDLAVLVRLYVLAALKI